jgi:hypothetical protein
MKPEATPQEKLVDPSGPWTDLGLTLPIFCAYHLGVVFLPVRNAADLVTQKLQSLADHSLLAYAALTLAIGAVYAGVLVVAGRGHALQGSRFLSIAVEGVVYAVAMRLVAGWVVGSLHLAAGEPVGAFTGLVMSLGAGFYEEVAFRVVLWGLGWRLLTALFPGSKTRDALVGAGWALVCAVVFSGWHYVGALGDAFELRSFVFRLVCGLVFTVIYRFRGFAPAVWTHTLYDVWVMVL